MLLGGNSTGRLIFQHKPLILSSNEIRLLTLQSDLTSDGHIQCSLDHISQSDASYSCLSYMWGGETNQKSIIVNGCSLSVRSNLWDFLDIARWKLHSIPFWIDAVCIDQANTHEKNHQVAMMGEIYKQAEIVYAFLGTGDPTLAEVMRFLHEREHQFPVPEHRDWLSGGNASPSHFLRTEFWQKTDEDTRMALSKVCNLPYWKRAWIQQELLLTTALRLLYDRWQCTGEFFAALIVTGRSLNYTYLMSTNAYDWCMSNYRRQGDAPVRAYSTDLASALQLTRGTSCSDARDRVYAVRSLAHEGRALPVDYSCTTLQLYVRTLATMITSPVGVAGPSIGEFLDRSLDLFEMLELQTTVLSPPIITQLVQDLKVQQGSIRLAIGRESRCLSASTSQERANNDLDFRLIFKDYDGHFSGAKPTAVKSNFVLEAGDCLYGKDTTNFANREPTFFILARKRSASQDLLDVVAYVLWPRHEEDHHEEPRPSRYNTTYLYVPSVPGHHGYVTFEGRYRSPPTFFEWD